MVWYPSHGRFEVNLLQRMREVAKRDPELSDYLIWRELDEKELTEKEKQTANLEELEKQSNGIDWRIAKNGYQQDEWDTANDKEVELFDWSKMTIDKLSPEVVARNLFELLAIKCELPMQDVKILCLEVSGL